MPTNLPPDYYEVEKQYRATSDITEKIAYLEEMLSIVPKHKGTDHLRADLRRKLSKLKTSSKAKKVSRRDSAFNINKEGAGQVAVIGAPNTGKSSLVKKLTNATPDISPAPYTTWNPTPGMMHIDNVQIQLIDTPPLDREFTKPILYHLFRRADMLLLMVDLETNPVQQLENTLELLVENRIIPHHISDEYAEETRVVVKPCLVVANKCDNEEEVELFNIFRQMLDHDCELLPISATTGYNLEKLKKTVYQKLGIIRVYTKAPGKEPDFSAPFVLKEGDTVETLAGRIHKDFLETLKTARVWGQAVHDGQMVGRDYILLDGDVVELQT
jgi:small GTP-binding protein